MKNSRWKNKQKESTDAVMYANISKKMPEPQWIAWISTILPVYAGLTKMWLTQKWPWETGNKTESGMSVKFK